MAGNYPGWSPYNYVGDNPIKLIDLNGMDWYIQNETGALEWYNGKYKKSEIPKGYSWLGKDNYFNDKSIYKQLKKLGINTMNLTLEQSLKFAASFGFRLAPLESISDILTIFYKTGGEDIEYTLNMKYGENVWSKLTYVKNNSNWIEKSKSIKQGVGFFYVEELKRTKYKYLGVNNLIPILKASLWFLNATGGDFSQDHIKVYTWKTYPKNGPLQEWRKN